MVAVEPVAAMRAELHRSQPAVTVLDGTAEAIPLDDARVDGVVAAQAFHWFDAPAALAEIHRVLRPDGRLALVWNVRDASVDWVRRFEDVMVAAAGNKPYEPSVDWAGVVAAAGGYGPLHHERFTYGQEITAELLVERAASTSYVSALDDQARRDCLDEVAELARTHPDLAGRPRFTFPYFTDVFWCAADLTGFQAGLLTWTATTRRDLPWRDTRDPWAVLVSELMLQQTQVERVVPKYQAFLQRFPTVASCAASGVGEVVTLWAGLGYNRRAVNLHRCAGQVVNDHDGRLPCDLDALLALPGIGPYTARALLAFAWERDVGVVDTNAARVLARTEGRSLRASRGPGAGRPGRARGARLGLEPGDARSRRHGLPGPGPGVHALPRGLGLRLAPLRRGGAGPGPGLGGNQHRPVPLRRLGPPGAGTPRRSLAPRWPARPLGHRRRRRMARRSRPCRRGGGVAGA